MLHDSFKAGKQRLLLNEPGFWRQKRNSPNEGPAERFVGVSSAP